MAQCNSLLEDGTLLGATTDRIARSSLFCNIFIVYLRVYTFTLACHPRGLLLIIGRCRYRVKRCHPILGHKYPEPWLVQCSFRWQHAISEESHRRRCLVPGIIINLNNNWTGNEILYVTEEQQCAIISPPPPQKEKKYIITTFASCQLDNVTYDLCWEEVYNATIFLLWLSRPHRAII